MLLQDDNTNTIDLFFFKKTPRKIVKEAMICNISIVLVNTKDMIDVGHSVGRPIYCPFLYYSLWYCIPANTERGRFIHPVTLTV